MYSRRTSVGTNAVFEYPEVGRGFGAIPEGLSRPISRVYLGHRASRIDVERRRIEFNDGEIEVGYERLISTLPLPVLIELIPQAPRSVRQAASRLRHNSIVVVNLGVARDDLSNWHWSHYPESDISFFRISFPKNLDPALVPEGMSSISAEVSYSDWQPIDKSTIVDRVIADLRKVGILRHDDRIVLRDVIDIRFGYVIYDAFRKPAVVCIRDWLESVGIHTTGRYGLWAYLWSHEAILAGRQTGQRLARELAGAGNECFSVPGILNEEPDRLIDDEPTRSSATRE